ncbi:hypothetical protein GN244_ATG17071 [Phytophthora infestans]|uniref:Uncharacterized protein n=1 Tax=Phytophthora infestans TaxID=4787 RepID=A0A833WEL8_PHYIN|nr:hypothetical protein GN244_ATG17071 [Phytophthora infestans]
MTKNGATAYSSTSDNRLLRRVKNDEGEIDEERVINVKKAVQKLSPVKAAEKIKEKAEDVKDKLDFPAAWQKLVGHLKVH